MGILLRYLFILVPCFSEFCGHISLLLEPPCPGEVPEGSTGEYMLSPALEQGVETQSSAGLLVYCIDISGSMSVSSKLPDLQGKQCKAMF